MIKKFCLTRLTVFLIALVNLYPTVTKGITPEDLVAHFLSITKSNEEDNDANQITLWEKADATVAVIFEKHHSSVALKELFPLLEKVRDEIRAETNFTYLFPRQLNAQQPANVFVVYGHGHEILPFVSRFENGIGFSGLSEKLRKHLANSQPFCDAATLQNTKKEIVAALVAIGSGGNIGKCVNQTFFKIMGLNGKPPSLLPSVLSGRKQLTEIDKLMLRLAYSGQYRSGDTLNQNMVRQHILRQISH